MNFGLAVSIVLHLGVLAWALITIAATPPLKLPDPEPVEVAIVTSDEIVRLKQGDRAARQLEAQPAPTTERSTAKQEPPRPKPVAAAPPPPPPQEPAKTERPPPPEPKSDPIADKLAGLPPEPAPGPSPEELERLEAQKKAEEAKQRIEAQKKAEAEKKRREALKKKQAEAKRIAEAKKKAEEPNKKSFDDKMAEAIEKSALRDVDPTKKPPPAGGAPAPTLTAKSKGPVAGAPTGRDNALTSSQRAMIAVLMKQAVSKCWNINSGLDGIDKIVVELEVRLTPEGRLAQPPKVVSSGSGTLFTDAANSALRALEQCQPYELPREFYETGWRHMIVDFKPERNF